MAVRYWNVGDSDQQNQKKIVKVLHKLASNIEAGRAKRARYDDTREVLDETPCAEAGCPGCEGKHWRPTGRYDYEFSIEWDGRPPRIP